MTSEISENLPAREHLYTYRATVRGNFDGDTVRVDVDLGMGHVYKGPEGKGLALRLLGIDTPEIAKGPAASRAKAKEARDALAAMLAPGSEVLIRTVKDSTEKFGRYLVVIVTSTGVCVNAAMLESGHAKVYV